MKPQKAGSLWVLAVGLALTSACGHQSAVPVTDAGIAAAADDEQLPFDREGRKQGISPSSDLIPPAPGMPAGMPITIRPQQSVSSATAHAGDTFQASLDEPIIVNGQTIADRGTPVVGRVMEAAASEQSPGYLRLALTSILIQDTPVPLQSSSAFLKALAPVPPRTRGRPAHLAMLRDAAVSGSQEPGAAPHGGSGADTRSAPKSMDVTVGSDRSLTFRLREAVTLPQ
jgi:hypothetical protein